MKSSSVIGETRGSIRLPKEHAEWIRALHDIYEFEASRISGPGSWKRDINEVLWTYDELLLALESTHSEKKTEYKALIDWMVTNRHAMMVMHPERGTLYITRVAEIIRLLGHTPEYWYRGRPGIEAVRWLVEYKRIPRRSIPQEQFIEEVLDAVDRHVSIQQWKVNLKLAIRQVMPVIAKAIARGASIKEREVAFSRFQLEATIEMLLAEFAPGSTKPAQVITAGVGSGKTYAFLIPTLISALARILAGEPRTTLLLYPRKALAKDQFTVVDEIVTALNRPGLDIHLEHYEHYAAQKRSVKEGMAIVYVDNRPPPAIIITTYETLKRRLHHSMFVKNVASYLGRVVLDEVHLIEGLSGANVVRLMDRLGALCKIAQTHPDVSWTASSATVANPHVHAGVIFGLPSKEVRVVQQTEEEMQEVGLVHHVFLRPSGRISNLGAIVNASSLLVHNRRTDVGFRDKRDFPKTLAFADNLDLLGRWNADLRENERTESAYRRRRHPNTANRHEWGVLEREVPYATRFRQPLQNRIDVEGGKSGQKSEPYAPVLVEHRNEGICDRCQKGERISLGERTPEEIRELSILVYRRPHDRRNDEVKTFWIRNQRIFDARTKQEVGTLDLCPYLRAGACYWFPAETETPEQIPGTRSYYEWKSVARSKIHTAKTASNSDLPDEDLAEIVFRAPVQEIYDVESNAAPIPIDMVLASPSLEVGIDLTNVTESIMFHAIRNVASYRQKAGRIGREERSDVLNVSLISDRPIDLHFYRQPRKLASLAQLDPLPLKDTNAAVLRSALYMAVWDWLAYDGLPDPISFRTDADGTELSKALMRSLNSLRISRKLVANHLANLSRRLPPSHPDIQEAITQVERELEFLLSDVGELLTPNVHFLADAIPYTISTHGSRLEPTAKAKDLFSRLNEKSAEYNRTRPKINPLELNLKEEFRLLDMMAACGWRIEWLNPIVDKLEREAAKPESRPEQILDLTDLIDVVRKIRILLRTYALDALPMYFYNQFRRYAEVNRAQAHYLSYILENVEVLQLFRLRPEYVRTKNLFTRPYEEEVLVSGIKGGVQSVPLSEALFSLIPATWTYRFGRKSIKVTSGRATPAGEGVLSISYDQLTTRGSDFVTVKQNVPGPWGLPATFDIVRPRRLDARELQDKYVPLDYVTGSVMDGDENAAAGLEERGERKLVKIPKSYLNRWVVVEADVGEPISVASQDLDYLKILSQDGKSESSGKDAANRIKHPLAAALLSDVRWHMKMQATEFVYSCSRTYTSTQVTGVEILFESQSRSRMAFGRTIETEGISIELERSLADEVRESVSKSIMEGNQSWASSGIKFFTYHLNLIGTESARISPYIVRDLVGVILSSMYEKGTRARTPVALANEMQTLAKDADRFTKYASLYYKGSSVLEEEDADNLRPDLEIRDADRDRAELETNVRRLSSALNRLAGKMAISNIEDNLRSWIIYTLLNSFGTAASNALQRLAGVTDEVVGYAVDFQGAKEQRYRIFLYDKDELGSGSCDVARNFLHILHIQRHGENVDSILLPTDDFFTLLEEELLQCAQHHTDISALEMIKQAANGATVPNGISMLGYVLPQSREVLENSQLTWNNLNIMGRGDAWKLPILRHQAQILARENLEVDDVIRATTICWNGCPECLINRETGAGPVGEQLQDKAVLDELFRRGRKRSREYLDIYPMQLVEGKISLPFGRLSRVVLDLPNKRVRSASLPYTVGIEVPRQSNEEPRLIIRASDIEGFSLFEKVRGAALGLESLGFRRLLWHDLVMTAYLDLLGVVPPERKRIEAVFYDCRDIDFEDVGVSSRMLDAITEHARSAKAMLEPPQKLTDILVWLAKRGFSISLCVERERLAEEGVRSFANRLIQQKCVVVSKNLARIMHKKAILTPVGALVGSANLTVGGTKGNEEIVNYAQWGTQAYLEIQTAVDDTFQGATHIR
jgi:hypothetical protein